VRLFKTEESSRADVRALLQAVTLLQDRVAQLEASVAEARMRYLEALDKTVTRLQGRLARKLREEAREDAPGPTIHDGPSLHYPPESARRSNLRGW